jgi:hypothetical protein
MNGKVLVSAYAIEQSDFKMFEFQLITSGAGTACPSGAPKFPVFVGFILLQDISGKSRLAV